jgi:hypothetical protein
MTHDINDFSSFTAFNHPKEVFVANGKTGLKWYGTGIVNGHTVVNGKEQNIALQGVLYVPTLKDRFISTTALDLKGFKMTFQNGSGTIEKNGKVFSIGKRYGLLYWLPIHVHPCHHSITQSNLPIKLWHRHLGHLNWNALEPLFGPSRILTSFRCTLSKTSLRHKHL